MKKLATAALCFFGAIAMAACTGTESAQSDKSTLEKAGWTVSVYTAEEYKTTTTAEIFEMTEGLTNNLVAVKAPTDGSINAEALTAFYFGSFEQAEEFQHKNFATLYRLFGGDSQATSYGIRNNVAYAGHKTAINLLGWATV